MCVVIASEYEIMKSCYAVYLKWILETFCFQEIFVLSVSFLFFSFLSFSCSSFMVSYVYIVVIMLCSWILTNDWWNQLPRGCYTPNQKLACFVLYLKIINPILKNTCIQIHANFSRNSKMALDFFFFFVIGQAVFKLRIKTVKILFWSITQEPLGLLWF